MPHNKPQTSNNSGRVSDQELLAALAEIQNIYLHSSGTPTSLYAPLLDILRKFTGASHAKILLKKDHRESKCHLLEITSPKETSVLDKHLSKAGKFTLEMNQEVMIKTWPDHPEPDSFANAEPDPCYLLSLPVGYGQKIYGSLVLHGCKRLFAKGSYERSKPVLQAAVAKIHHAAQQIENDQLSDRLNQLQATANIGAWSFETKSGDIIWTKQMFEIFPETKETGEPDFERQRSTIHREDRALWEENVTKCSEDGQPYVMKFRVVHPEGKIVWVEAHGQGTTDKNGKVVKLFGTCQDITQSARLQSELHEAKELLQTTLDYMPGPVYAKDRNGKFIFVNSKFYDAVTGNTDSVVGKTMFDMFPQEVADELYKNDLKIFNDNKTFHFKEEVPHPDGSMRMYDTYKFPLFDDHGEVFAATGISIDITESHRREKEFEEQRKIAQINSKLASIGELAAGVGHEINNPLTIANGSVFRIQKALRLGGITDPVVDDAVTKFKLASDRIAKIVSGLRTFARNDSDEVAPFDLKDTVDQTLQLVSEIYSKDGLKIEFENKASGNLTINGRMSRIQQVIMNLLQNAKDALEDKQEKSVIMTLESDGETAFLKVRDNGPGIPEDVKERIFDTFFTTKDVGKGTGIGLSLSLSIVREHQGDISVQSGPQGTTFTVNMPLASNSAALPLPEKTKDGPKIKPVTNAHVLIVDDEPDIREILAYYLHEQNHTTEEAANGIEALDKIKKGTFDIVITDLKMPRMNGFTLVSKIRDSTEIQQPKIIAITGGVSEEKQASIDEKLIPLVDGFILKPFSEEDLAATLAAIQTLEKKSA